MVGAATTVRGLREAAPAVPAAPATQHTTTQMMMIGKMMVRKTPATVTPTIKPTISNWHSKKNILKVIKPSKFTV